MKNKSEYEKEAFCPSTGIQEHHFGQKDVFEEN